MKFALIGGTGALGRQVLRADVAEFLLTRLTGTDHLSRFPLLTY